MNKELLKKFARRALAVLLVVLWSMVIFRFSSQDAQTSSGLSGGMSQSIAIDYSEMFHLNLNDWEIEKIVTIIEHPLRKCAHITEYGILALCLFNLLDAFAISSKWCYMLSFGISVLYACCDEIHQLFSDGRSAQVSDVIIDSVGAAIMVGLISLVKKGKQRRKGNDGKCE